MANLTTRLGLIEYCLKRLGFPVIEINVDDDQVEDRIDDTIQIYRDYHYDAVERYYYVHQIDQATIDDKSFALPESLLSVIRVLPFGGAGANNLYPLGDTNLSWSSTTINPFAATSTGSGSSMTNGDQAGGGVSSFSLSSYYLNMQKLADLEATFNLETPIRFNRHTDKVYLDMDTSTLKIGSYLIVEGWAALDPEVYTDVYNDRWIKRYATAMIKQQWGSNLIKYSGVALPGGVTLDGDKIYQQASDEIDKLESEMSDKYELPVDFVLG